MEGVDTALQRHFHIPHISSVLRTFSTRFLVDHWLRAAIFVLFEVSSCISGIKTRNRVRLFVLQLSNVIYCFSQDQ